MLGELVTSNLPKQRSQSRAQAEGAQEFGGGAVWGALTDFPGFDGDWADADNDCERLACKAKALPGLAHFAWLGGQGVFGPFESAGVDALGFHFQSD